MQSKFKKEKIAIGSKLFRHSTKHHISNKGTINPITFAERPNEKGMGISTDWEKYAEPRDSLSRAPENFKGGVIDLKVAQVLEIPNQTVEHTPSNVNQAHTSIKGQKDEEERLKLRRISTWDIESKKI